MNWTQVYIPVLDNVFISALIAAIPVIVLLGLLAFWHVKAHISALLGLVSALVVAILIYRMPPPWRAWRRSREPSTACCPSAGSC